MHLLGYPSLEIWILLELIQDLSFHFQPLVTCSLLAGVQKEHWKTDPSDHPVLHPENIWGGNGESNASAFTGHQ